MFGGADKCCGLLAALQLGFNDFLQKCEILEFDFDPKAIQQGRLHARDMQKFKVGYPDVCRQKLPAQAYVLPSPLQPWKAIARFCQANMWCKGGNPHP